ncbi:hypothetical protein B4135_2217 [Caldibacillus debilis]|uniref:Uncharacterized protein n=1 Tax=Caldibacillus debilis TaxID=301148 RepID=A0A150M289_9BACI|nr:hypothetical protein B4135_2217 [Caldibacillus debilis]
MADQEVTQPEFSVRNKSSSPSPDFSFKNRPGIFFGNFVYC